MRQSSTITNKKQIVFGDTIRKTVDYSTDQLTPGNESEETIRANLNKLHKRQSMLVQDT